ncbi:MAG: fucose 4-O-acetylase [Naasia sp.]|nr:fucose 4-O-acetylase [Naasia sp.]
MTSAGTPAGTRTRTRVPLWDNARSVAIFLVVAGHAVQRMALDYDPALAVYLFIYAFHVPLFVLVSGHFSKDRLELRDLRRLVTDLVVPYLIFETIWTTLQWLVEGNTTVNYANASWTLWFLIALLVWRLLLPLIAVLRFPLVWAAAAAMVSGYTEDIDSTLALSRTFALLPFFVLGWQLRTWRAGERWQEATRRTVLLVRIAAGVLVTATAAAIVVGLPFWREATIKYFFFADDPYVQFGYTEWWAGLLRLAVVVYSALLCLAVLGLLPRHETWYSPLGAATLYVYLLHTFALYPLRETGVLREAASVPGLLAALALAGALTLALSSPLVRRVFRPIVEPRAGFLLRRYP